MTTTPPGIQLAQSGDMADRYRLALRFGPRWRLKVYRDMERRRGRRVERPDVSTVSAAAVTVMNAWNGGLGAMSDPTFALSICERQGHNELYPLLAAAAKNEIRPLQLWCRDNTSLDDMCVLEPVEPTEQPDLFDGRDQQ